MALDRLMGSLTLEQEIATSHMPSCTVEQIDPAELLRMLQAQQSALQRIAKELEETRCNLEREIAALEARARPTTEDLPRRNTSPVPPNMPKQKTREQRKRLTEKSPLTALNLEEDTFRWIHSFGARRVSSLTGCTKKFLMEQPGFEPQYLTDIEAKLDVHGFRLKDPASLRGESLRDAPTVGYPANPPTSGRSGRKPDGG